MSDLYDRRVISAGPRNDPEASTDVEVEVEVDDDIGGIGWLPDGTLLAVSMGRRQILRRRPSGELEVHADLSALTSSRLNDLVVDGRGHAWVGNYGFDLDGGEAPRAGSLFLIPPAGGSASVAVEDLFFPNGAVVSADGTRLIVGETFAGRYTSFAIGGDGALGDRRTWATFGPAPDLTTTLEMFVALEVVPDGCAIDAEGCLWVADVKGARCLRVAPGGDVLQELHVTGGSCFACGLGGADGRTLVLCAAPSSFKPDCLAARRAVALWTTVDVPSPHHP